MKTKTGMSIGLALTLMVGVFATMLALGLFTTSPRCEAQDHGGQPVCGVTVSFTIVDVRQRSTGRQLDGVTV